MDIIKVSGSSRTSAVAGAIAGVFREYKHAEVQAIGAGAVNQAVKACVLATGYLAADGLDVVFTPEFVDVEIDDKTRTAIRLVVELRYSPRPAAEIPTFTAEVEAEAEQDAVPDVEQEPSPYPPDPPAEETAFSTISTEGYSETELTPFSSDRQEGGE
jgi:stage V sporulation protein S